MNKNYYNSNMDYNYINNGKCNSPCTGGTETWNTYNNTDDSYIVGNSVDFTVGKCDSEIKADLTVGYRDTVRVWGQIKDCNGNTVPYAYLKLIKVSKNGQEGVAHTISDCLGYYQFDLCQCEAEGINYRLLVGKASVGGGERIIASGLTGTNCNPCNSADLSICDCK